MEDLLLREGVEGVEQIQEPRLEAADMPPARISRIYQLPLPLQHRVTLLLKIWLQGRENSDVYKRQQQEVLHWRYMPFGGYLWLLEWDLELLLQPAVFLLLLQQGFQQYGG